MTVRRVQVCDVNIDSADHCGTFGSIVSHPHPPYLDHPSAEPVNLASMSTRNRLRRRWDYPNGNVLAN